MTPILDRIVAFAKRTNLVRLLALYFSAAFVVLQLVDMFSDQLRLPGWLFTGTLFAIVIGLPVTIGAAVAYAAKRDGPGVQPESRVRQQHVDQYHALTWRRVGIMVVGIFALWGLIAAAWLVVRPASTDSARAAIAEGSLQIEAIPANASFAVRRVLPIDSFEHRTPEQLDSKLPAGDYVVTVTAPGYNDLELIATVVGDSTRKLSVQLVRDAPETRNMVYVPASGGSPAFLIDKFEVTNAEYLEFVSAGGYRDTAMRKFVDRTGNPGPRGWSGGLYPQGAGEHPVVGVSWSEAMAYAKWRGKTLPTAEQWWRAAVAPGAMYPWGNDTEAIEKRANFSLAAPSKVGAYALGVSWIGAHDMAGNVREWLRDDRDPAKRIAVGGSWQDPVYVFDPEFDEGFPPDYANELIGLRCIREIR